MGNYFFISRNIKKKNCNERKKFQPQLVTKYGYSSESHEVRTDDGYFLTVHRISGGKKYPPKAGKAVVFLQHGILASSAVWVLAGPNKGLGELTALTIIT